MIHLNDLPTIVTGPGDYKTRMGDRVTVYEVKPEREHEKGCTSFRVKGSIWRTYRGKYCPRGYDIWHVSGRGFPLRESNKDIVGLWEPNQ